MVGVATPPPVLQSAATDWQPERLVRTCVATTRDSEAFGRWVGAEARARNFEAASQRAFVGDEQAYHWAIHRRWFAGYVAVVDFVHLRGDVWQVAGTKRSSGIGTRTGGAAAGRVGYRRCRPNWTPSKCDSASLRRTRRGPTRGWYGRGHAATCGTTRGG
jgi:hypothetical protein